MKGIIFKKYRCAFKTKSFSSKIVKSFFLVLITVPLLSIVSCSSSEDEPKNPINEETSKPYSVTVYETNKNLPAPGKLISEFSDSPNNYDISKAIDGNKNSDFVTEKNEFYIQFNADYNVIVTDYSFTSSIKSPTKDPKSWDFFGSNDNSKWNLIDSRENQVFDSRSQTKQYTFVNDKEYKYYKFQINGNNGGKGVQIAELRINGYPSSVDDIISKYAEGYSDSSSTPMGNHYANKHQTTDEDVAWLINPDNEPETPSHVSHLKWQEKKIVLYPFGEPLPADVNQHSIGDCSALAVFASMAYVYPEFVKSLITDNGNNSYTVSMFDPQGKEVKVAVSSKVLVDDNGTIQAVSGKNNVATWATVLEKAIIKWNCIYKVNTDIGGIGSEHVAPLFTGDGNSFAFYPGKLSAYQMARVVKVSLINGKIMVGGFNKGGLNADGGQTVTGHAFTLMHSKNSSALFTMRNPWGGEKDGILNILNDGTIQPTIDLRIINPGKASEFGSGILVPYNPPSFSAAQNKVRITSNL
ncbi:MAG: C2 family cysteine protease [Bacteroidales bacterium]|nr:C2 family cysteine protease [Bacteroidales bacterium]